MPGRVLARLLSFNGEVKTASNSADLGDGQPSTESGGISSSQFCSILRLTSARRFARKRQHRREISATMKKQFFLTRAALRRKGVPTWGSLMTCAGIWISSHEALGLGEQLSPEFRTKELDGKTRFLPFLCPSALS